MLQNISREVLVLHDVGQHVTYVICIDFEVLALFIRRIEADLVQHAFHDGVQAARSDVFGPFVDPEGKTGNFFQRVLGEFQLHIFGLE
jgi:hypothetical protein